jgi:predicted CXXCH cytochrome family protein
MVYTEMSVGTKWILTTILTCLIILATIVPFCRGEEGPGMGSNRCAYSRLLEAPHYKERYQRNLLRSRVYNDSERMYGTIIKTSIGDQDGNYLGTLDTFSTGCIVCHDGVVTPMKKLNFRNNPESRMQMISGKHPIGMDYARYAAVNGDLRRPEQLNPKLVLIGGKVSCVTCHDPLNPKKNHLALNDSARELCMECHSY